MLRIGSLFSGIGGLELGLERSGLGRVVWQCEIDAFCRSVLARHWPDVVRFEDVRTIRKNAVEPVDLICGGFPCQDVSSAGKGAGLDGARSGLWFEYRRVIQELQPRFVIVENVASGKARWLPTVRRNLCDDGYTSRAYSISAIDVGAPHLRRRVFVVAVSNGDGHPVRHGSEREPRRWPGELPGQGRAEPADDRQDMADSDSDGRKRVAAAIDSHRAEATEPAGPRTSQTAVLNPRFVEALMGFPPGWTTLPSRQTMLPWPSKSRP